MNDVDFLWQTAARLFLVSFVLETCSEVDVRGADNPGIDTLNCNIDFRRQAAAYLFPPSFMLETCTEVDMRE